MPIDPHAYDEDDEGGVEGHLRRFDEFECPECAASNPYDDRFGDGDEILCFYCGQQFKVSVTEAGRLKVKAL